MFLLQSCAFLLLITFAINDEETSTENVRNCRENNRLIGTEQGDDYKVVDALLGETIKLQCHYCHEADDNRPKIWYKSNLYGNLSIREVQLDMETDPLLSRVHVTVQHTLIIRNTSIEDAGIYYCHGTDGQEAKQKYNFLIDVVFTNISKPETGNMTKWREYHSGYFDPINKLFASSREGNFTYLRDILEVRLELVTDWQEWGECEVCGRPQGEGRSVKMGFCRIKVTHLKYKPPIIAGNDSESVKLEFLSVVSKVSCHSVLFANLFPGVGLRTRTVPHFKQTRHCDGTCNPDAEGIYRGWKSTKTTGFKYRKSFVLTENTHLTIVCPESTLENKVIWRRNRKILKPGESVYSEKHSEDLEPHITVDTFNSLHLLSVTDEQEGNYTCYVDDIRMQQVVIYVVSKSKILTQAFLRYMMYLAFILSLTLSCYCAGLVVTFTRRHRFKDYSELQNVDDDDDA